MHWTRFKKLRGAGFGLIAHCLLVPLAGAAELEKLPEAARDDAKRWAVVFDFDKDGCYPSSAISPKGEINPGLAPRGAIDGQCRDPEQLDNSNTYYRTASIRSKDGTLYRVQMYALYFKKDQATGVIGGHKHDWEFALVWTKDGHLTHGSYSAHGKVTTLDKGKLHFDPDKGDTVKVVYHKDGPLIGAGVVGTHAFRFAKEDEKGDAAAENHAKRWITPAIVDWHLMTGAGLTNEELRKRLNEHDFGSANCSVNDHNFPEAIAKSPPEGYPPGHEWKAAAFANARRKNRIRDFNGDGRPDMLAFHPSDGSVWVGLSTGKQFEGKEWARFRSSDNAAFKLLVGDFDGDGRDDLIAFHPSDGSVSVGLSNGRSFDGREWAKFRSNDNGSYRLDVGDFDGDGRDDLLAYHPSDGSVWIGLSTGSRFDGSTWATFRSNDNGSYRLQASDFNGDGRDDLLAFHPSDGSMWVGESTGSKFEGGDWAKFRSNDNAAFNFADTHMR